MSLIKPFAALKPAVGRAADVLAPPYDVLSTAEARTQVEGRPYSFLHISRAEIDLAADADPHAPAVYRKAAENLAGFIAAGILEREAQPAYYVYRLEWQGHAQTGLCMIASVAAYEAQRIRRHEFTRPEKEDDRVRQIEALRAQTGPVFLAYPESAAADELLAAASAPAAAVDVLAATGVRHRLWTLREPAQIEALTAAFEAMPALYIADGHHRCAAAARVAAARRAQGSAAAAADQYFLAVAFPHHALRILEYNRLVRDLNGLSPRALLERLAVSFVVTASDHPVQPQRPRDFGLYVDGRWYRLTLAEHCVPGADPVDQLDVSLLQDRVLGPLLGITDPRRDARIDFVGGIRGLDALVKRVDSGEMAAAFSLYPTPMGALMAVADAGRVMPPKSTWFEPKLADGLLSHVLD